ncbi:MFS transporter [Brevibacillus migulae]|uniref:MFS transporter n=1 Tax=Brevibacillus migulae TaxID=1644114 RepID=UPI00106E26E4|nr:MFS transporter [Brevibacillus migulae]
MLLLWKQSSFRLYWLGLFLSGLGDQFGWLALSWFVMKKTGSPLAMGGVVFTYFLSQVAAALVAGVLLDRFDRRKLIIFDNLFRGSIYVIIVLLLQTNAPLWMLYACITIAGLLAPLSNTGAQTMLPRLVQDKDLLLKANGMMETNWQIAYLLGPAAAGVLVSWVGEAMVLIIDAASFFLCAVCFWFLPSDDAGEGGSKHQKESRWTSSLLDSLQTDFRTGFHYLFANPLLLSLILLTFLFNMAYGPIEVGLPLYVTSVLQDEATSLGLLWMAFAFGSLGGSLFFSLVNWRVPTGYSLGSIIALWGVTTLPLGLSHRLDLGMISMALAGMTFAPFGVLYRTYLQRQIPQELMGRVLTSIRTITGLGLPVGSFLTGWLIPWIGINQLFLAAAFFSMVAGAFALFALRGIRP